MKQVITLFVLSTAITTFILGVNFISAVQIGLEEAASGNVGIVEPIFVLGVLLIFAVSILAAMGR